MCNDEAMTISYEPPMPRFAADVIEKQHHNVEHAKSTGVIQHGRDELVMVINQARQIVYASPKLIEVFGGRPLGRRPGEMLKCVNAGEDKCGLTELCRYCGAAKAIVDAQRTSQEVNGECVVQTKSNGLSITYNFNNRKPDRRDTEPKTARLGGKRHVESEQADYHFGRACGDGYYAI
jgi:hypothetical protein